MSSERRRAARVGALVVLAAVVLAAFVLSLSSRMGPLTGRTRYSARFSSIQGLSQGAEVRLVGVTVGEVESIELAPPPGPPDYFSTMSLLIGPSTPRSSSFSACPTLNLSSAFTRSSTSASNAGPSMPMPACAVFMSRPV